MDSKKIMDSLFKENFELEQQRDQYKAERDTLIDDLPWYKANVSILEDEKDDMLLEREYYKNLYEDMTRRGKEMERENRFLLSRKDNLFDSWRDENKRSVALSKKNRAVETRFITY